MSVTNLKSAVPAIICVLVLTGTLLGGFLPRRQSAGDSAKLLSRAAAKLDRPLPERIGAWRLLLEGKLEPDVARILQCPAYINRVYVHERTGDRVSVAVLLGPGGPIAVHTPEICYSSQDYKLDGERTLRKLTDKQGNEQTFWAVDFQPNRDTGSPMRVLYGWSDGSHWEAPADPRYDHAWRPYLYKLQIGGPVTSNVADFKPCQDFLTQFIELVRPQLLPPDPA